MSTETPLPIHLSQIFTYLPNMVTTFRFLLLYFSIAIYGSAPEQACSLLIMSVILDYVDGIVARKSHQCSFFGDCFDWVTDVSSYALVLFWWSGLKPRLTMLIFTLIVLEITSMMTDVIAKCNGYHPKLETDGCLNFILRYTMDCGRRGYNCKGLGFWNEIFHFLCIISRILYLQTQSHFWLFLFIVNLPMSISYVWMNLAYTKSILGRWNEEQQEKESKVKFIQ